MGWAGKNCRWPILWISHPPSSISPATSLCLQILVQSAPSEAESPECSIQPFPTLLDACNGLAAHYEQQRAPLYVRRKRVPCVPYQQVPFPVAQQIPQLTQHPPPEPAVYIIEQHWLSPVSYSSIQESNDSEATGNLYMLGARNGPAEINGNLILSFHAAEVQTANSPFTCGNFDLQGVCKSAEFTRGFDAGRRTDLPLFDPFESFKPTNPPNVGRLPSGTTINQPTPSRE